MSISKYALSSLGCTLLALGVGSFSAHAQSPSSISTAPQPLQPANEASPLVAQVIETTEPIERSRFSVGVSGNIGITGGRAMGESSVSINGRVGLTDTLSLRPSVGLTSDPNITVPLTVDFPAAPEPGFGNSVTPYIGGGVVVTTGNNSQVGPMATVGVDVPITNDVGASVSVNAGFLDQTQVGASAGISYSF